MFKTTQKTISDIGTEILTFLRDATADIARSCCVDDAPLRRATFGAALKLQCLVRSYCNLQVLRTCAG